MRTSKEQKAQQVMKQKFAALFTAENAGTFGDIDGTNALLGTQFDLCDDDIRRYIEANGKVAPPCGTVGKISVQRAQVHNETDGADLSTDASNRESEWRGDFSLPSPDAEKDEWCRKYREIEPVLNDIAVGSVKASAAQAKILSNITDRCFGPVVREAETQEKSGVILLPTLGMGSTMMVCPVCGHTEMKDDEVVSE